MQDDWTLRKGLDADNNLKIDYKNLIILQYEKSREKQLEEDKEYQKQKKEDQKEMTEKEKEKDDKERIEILKNAKVDPS